MLKTKRLIFNLKINLIDLKYLRCYNIEKKYTGSEKYEKNKIKEKE